MKEAPLAFAQDAAAAPSAPVPPTQIAMLQDEERALPPDELTESYVRLSVPSPDVLFQRDSEKSLMERMRQGELDKGRRIIFPREPAISKEAYAGRHFPPASEVVEPNYLCHKRLFFEEINSERYGWDLGIIQPLVSTGVFFWDVAWLPYHAFTRPCECYECNAGYCLPGDPVPYLCYPPEISVTGMAAEAGAAAALFAIFP
jgi:hypothetical protein